ncbi:type II toxin-antitoxin system HicA family toxin [Nocardia noduli]|uniref:type II toxin-antitoxin system HicA family toxin n=1 Tax=Nocardia noduli TaxID=2815722 RepID=UPI001C24955A|nr:type II toxin-antitoxin system HicA family toxin [Nocardia noduli]
MISEQPTRIVIKTLRNAGWAYKRDAKGSHEMWQCRTGKHDFSLPAGHDSIRPGIVRKMQKAIAECDCKEAE